MTYVCAADLHRHRTWPFINAGYSECPQCFPPLEHGVSILDLLFNVGPEAPCYIWGWREEK